MQWRLKVQRIKHAWRFCQTYNKRSKPTTAEAAEAASYNLLAFTKHSDAIFSHEKHMRIARAISRNHLSSPKLLQPNVHFKKRQLSLSFWVAHVLGIFDYFWWITITLAISKQISPHKLHRNDFASLSLSRSSPLHAERTMRVEKWRKSKLIAVICSYLFFFGWMFYNHHFGMNSKWSSERYEFVVNARKLIQSKWRWNSLIAAHEGVVTGWLG